MKKEYTAPEELLAQFAQERGILRAADLAERGIPRWVLSRLVNSGDLDPVQEDAVFGMKNRTAEAHLSLCPYESCDYWRSGAV